MRRSKIDKLVALSFDEDPEVRKKVAIQLGELDDPGALLALAELSYDKDEGVASVAKKILEERKKKPPAMLPFHELFKGVNFAGGVEKKEEDKEDIQHPDKMLEPIYKIFFEKFKDKKKAEEAMKKFVSNLMKEKKATAQKFITAYVESVGNVESINETSSSTQLQKEGKGAKTGETEDVALPKKAQPEDVEKPLSESPSIEDIGEIEVIGESIDLDLIGEEAKSIERDEFFTLEEKKALDIEDAQPSVFRIIYDQFLALEGDERLMKRQAKIFEDFFKKQVKLAYNIAKKKFKEIKLTDISNIKDGMRGITTDLLEVVDVKHLKYMRTKTKEDIYTRVVLRDPEGKEGVLYLFEGRGSLIKPGMKLRLEKAKAKTFKFSGETALTVDKRGKVIVEF